MENKKHISAPELAKILGISHVAVFKKIKAGQIKAKKVGRNFVIEAKNLPEILGTVINKRQRMVIVRAVKRAVDQYGETFRLLGME